MDIRVAAEQARVALQDAWVEQRAWLDDRDLPHDGCVLLPKISAALASLEAALAAQPEQQQGLVAASPATAAQQSITKEQALESLSEVGLWLSRDPHALRLRQFIEQASPAAAAGVPIPLSDAQMLLAWMDETFGNEDGTDWQDEDAAAVGDALNKAIENFKRMRSALASPVAPVGAPTEELRQIEHALWVLLEHTTLHFGDKHNTVVEAQRARHTARALLSRQGCELATDATKQLGEHSVHLAATPIDQDFRMRPASSEAAPSAEESWPVAYIWQPGMSIKRFLAFELPDCECTFEPLYSGPTARHAPELLEALQEMVEEKADYMRINHLGDPEKTHTVKWARAAIAKALGTPDSASGSPSSYRAEPDGQDLNPVSVKDLSASASPATKEQQ